MEGEKKQTEETQETQQEQKQEGREQKYEVRILRQISYLPTVFMLKTKWGQVIKISLISDYFIDCAKYVSRSGLTFEGCYKYQNNQLEESRGIYYTPIASMISVYSRNKISRDIEDMKNIISNILTNHGLANSKLLISYSNYTIEIYDKFVKGKLYEFEQIVEQGHLFIYNVPSPKYIRPDEFEVTRNIQIYNHVIESNGNIKLYHLYSSPGLAYLVYVPEYVMLTIKSPDHEEKLTDLYSNNYYIMAHPVPTRKVD